MANFAACTVSLSTRSKLRTRFTRHHNSERLIISKRYSRPRSGFPKLGGKPSAPSKRTSQLTGAKNVEKPMLQLRTGQNSGAEFTESHSDPEVARRSYRGRPGSLNQPPPASRRRLEIKGRVRMDLGARTRNCARRISRARLNAGLIPARALQASRARSGDAPEIKGYQQQSSPRSRVGGHNRAAGREAGVGPGIGRSLRIFGTGPRDHLRRGRAPGYLAGGSRAAQPRGEFNLFFEKGGMRERAL